MHNGMLPWYKRNVVSPLRVMNVCVADDTMQEKRNVVQPGI